MVCVGITYNKDHVLHDYMLKGFPGPENPAQVNSIIKYLQKSGFDAYYKEPLAQMNLTSKRKLTLLLEGVYHNEPGFLSTVVPGALSGAKNCKDDAGQMSLLAFRCTNGSKQFEEKVVRLKDMLSDHWQF